MRAVDLRFQTTCGAVAPPASRVVSPFMSESMPDPSTVERLVDAACEGDPDDLVAVVRQWPQAVKPYQRRLIDADALGSSMLMQGMDDETGDYLVGLIERGEGRRDRLISALAEGASSTGIAAMRRWIEAPPSWTPGLGYPWEQYPHFGAWEFQPSGEIR